MQSRCPLRRAAERLIGAAANRLSLRVARSKLHKYDPFCPLQEFWRLEGRLTGGNDIGPAQSEVDGSSVAGATPAEMAAYDYWTDAPESPNATDVSGFADSAAAADSAGHGGPRAGGNDEIGDAAAGGRRFSAPRRQGHGDGDVVYSVQLEALRVRRT